MKTRPTWTCDDALLRPSSTRRTRLTTGEGTWQPHPPTPTGTDAAN